MGPAGFEQATFRLSAERSNQAELWTHHRTKEENA
jgi:hypothetical protein